MATTRPDLDIVQELVTEFGENASYVADLLARYRINPASVDEEWRAFFRDRLGEPEPAPRPAETTRREAPPAEPAAEAAPAPARQPQAQAQAQEPRAPRAGEKPEPLRGAALRIAENMEESLKVPTATSVRTMGVPIAPSAPYIFECESEATTNEPGTT